MGITALSAAGASQAEVLSGLQMIKKVFMTDTTGGFRWLQH
jgi:hypothetical protein